MSNRSRVPADFNPWLALDALMGITDSLFWQLTEGPAADAVRDAETHARLVGLAYSARTLARELNTYFRAASEAGLELPAGSGKDSEVREEAPRYATLN